MTTVQFMERKHEAYIAKLGTNEDNMKTAAIPVLPQWI